MVRPRVPALLWSHSGGGIGFGRCAAAARSAQGAAHGVKHVLLISVDGLHQSDLKRYVADHRTRNSEAVRGGTEFSNAHTSDPADSDPGGTALMTGGDPRATGVYYGVEYSHARLAGHHRRSGRSGRQVIYDSPDDTLNAVPDCSTTAAATRSRPSTRAARSSRTASTRRGATTNLTPHPQSGLNPAIFPVDPKSCQPIMPWDYLKVNTIFQVIHKAGMRTAWSDKHAIYTSFNGPGSGGLSIDDLFAPEIDSQAVEPNGVPYPQDTDWAHIDAATKQYDGYKVQAIINELDGYDHSGRHKVGVPAILGMNFQAVSMPRRSTRRAPHARTGRQRTRWGRPSSPATTPERRPRVRCWPARCTTSTRNFSGWSTRSAERP